MHILVNTKDPLTAEADIIREFSEYGEQPSVISADQLFEWIEDHYPDMDEDAIEVLVDGADIDGDGDINYVEYSKLVCRQILHLDSTPLKVGTMTRILTEMIVPLLTCESRKLSKPLTLITAGIFHTKKSSP